MSDADRPPDALLDEDAYDPAGYADALAALVVEADEAFWAVVARRCPGWSGDVSPDFVDARRRANERDVTEWIEGNRPWSAADR